MGWEFDFLYLLQNIHNPVLDRIMVAVTTLGDAGILWIILSLIMLGSKKYRKCGVTMIVSLIIMIVFGNVVLKNIFMRQRPCWIDQTVRLLIDNPHDYSFPSGHTYSSIAAAMCIFLNYKKESIISILMALMISFSRLYLFVHFPTDVIASLLLGVITAFIAHIVVNRNYDKFLNRLNRKELMNND